MVDLKKVKTPSKSSNDRLVTFYKIVMIQLHTSRLFPTKRSYMVILLARGEIFTFAKLFEGFSGRLSAKEEEKKQIK